MLMAYFIYHWMGMRAIMLVLKHMLVDSGRMWRMNMRYDMCKLVCIYKLLRWMYHRRQYIGWKCRHTYTPLSAGWFPYTLITYVKTGEHVLMKIPIFQLWNHRHQYQNNTFIITSRKTVKKNIVEITIVKNKNKTVRCMAFPFFQKIWW